MGVSKDDLDPWLFMWGMHRRIDTDALPARRVALQVEFSGIPRGQRAKKDWWVCSTGNT